MLCNYEWVMLGVMWLEVTWVQETVSGPVKTGSGRVQAGSVPVAVQWSPSKPQREGEAASGEA